MTLYLDSTEILIEPTVSAALAWYTNTIKRPVLRCHFGRGNRQPYAAALRTRTNFCLHMPENELPDAYGIADKSLPESFGAQMRYRFMR